MAGYILSTEREKSTIKITVPGKDLIQNWWKNKKLFREAKVKRIQYHQMSFTTNVKGTYTVNKCNRRKKIYRINPKQLRKWQSVQFSCSVMSDSLWPHEPQYARPPCPSPTPRTCSRSWPYIQWCHPTISSLVVPFSSHLLSFQHQGLCKWVSSSH